MDDFIGLNVARWRRRRGLTQKVLAELCGLSQPYVSMLERGQRPVDKRSTIIALADALRVSVVELTGQPYPPTDPVHERASAAVPDIRAALVALGYGEVGKPTRTFGAVQADALRLTDLRMACDYAAAAQLAATLVLELAAHVKAGSREAARLLVMATHETAAVVKYLGYVELAYIAAEQTYAAARELDEPSYLGLAAYVRLQMLPRENLALGRRAAAASLELPGLTATADARQTLGMLHLMSALTDALLGATPDARSHLSEAQRLSRSMGEDRRLGGFAGLNFGPANVAQWRVTIAIETGEAGQAVELAKAVDPQAICATSRRSAFHIEHGNALAQTGQDRGALVAFLTAERMAPQRVRLTPAVRENVGAMLRRARRRAGSDELRSLAARVGVE